MGTHLLTPQMAGLLDRVRRAARAPLYTMNPQQARAAFEAGADVLDLPRAPLARVQPLSLPGGDGQPRAARLYAARAAPGPALLYLHGGGFVLGSLDSHDGLCRQLALRSGWTVVALDYRLAPEHPFPAGVDDAWAAMRELAARPAAFGISGLHAVGGDSAGGTLAAVSALHARDIGLPLDLQLLITPGTTAHADTASHRLFANGFLLDAATIAWMFDHTIPHHHRGDWRFAPLNAEPDGVAPACVILAECDPLVDEGLAYADRLRAAGVAVELDLVRGVTHDFIRMGRVLREAVPALDTAAQALRNARNPDEKS